MMPILYKCVPFISPTLQSYNYKGLKSSFLVSQIVQGYFTISPKIRPGNVQLKFLSILSPELSTQVNVKDTRFDSTTLSLLEIVLIPICTGVP